MTAKFKIVLLAGALLWFAGVAKPQENTQSPVTTSPVDSQGIKNYLLGPGDVIDVRVVGQSEMNAVVEVDSDGYLSSLPFVETPIRARCRTEKEIQRDITIAYTKFVRIPQVSVRILERKSRTPAAIWGAVRQPARIPMNRKVRLNEVIAVTGGFTERASGTIQILHTEPLMCPGPGEELLGAPIDGTNVPFEVVKISDMKLGRSKANLTIRPGDYIIVTEAEPIYITGSVVSPRDVFAKERLTLTTALAMVGGVKKEAKVNEIRIFRLKPDSTERETIRVDLADIQKNRRPDVPLQPFDWIEVPEAGVLDRGRLGSSLVEVFTRGVLSLPMHF